MKPSDATGRAAAEGSDDGEIEDEPRKQQPNYRRKDREEGEEDESDEDEDDDNEARGRREDTRISRDNKSSAAETKDAAAAKEKEKSDSEEEGEINDGEKVKKAFIPRVLCKYYQRGKCSWGRGCKFLHPGVNDTGKFLSSLFIDI